MAYKSIPYNILINNLNLTFKYYENIKYSTNFLKGGYTENNFSVLDVYLNGKKWSVKIKLLNIFKDGHIAAKLGTAAVGYDEWSSLSNVL